MRRSIKVFLRLAAIVVFQAVLQTLLRTKSSGSSSKSSSDLFDFGYYYSSFLPSQYSLPNLNETFALLPESLVGPFLEQDSQPQTQTQPRQAQHRHIHNFTWAPLSSPDDPGNALFYNIYIPPNVPNPVHAITIVKEQLGQVRQSSSQDNTTTLYYSLIGHANASELLQENGVWNSTQPPIRTQLLRQVRKGYEEVTLDALHAYCVDRPSAIVSYFHDKGSFHPTGYTEKRRFMSTKAALSKQCHGIDKNDECNTCSAVVEFYPHHYMPANMWTAKCSYVRQLLSPSEFGRKMLDMYTDLQQQQRRGYIKCLVTPQIAQIDATPGGFVKDSWPGVHRFSNEHWIAVHPHWKPCYTYPPGLLRRPNLLPFAKARPGRRPLSKQTIDDLLLNKGGPFWMTEGFVYRYKYLYGMDEPSWLAPLYTEAKGKDRCRSPAAVATAPLEQTAARNTASATSSRHRR